MMPSSIPITLASQVALELFCSKYKVSPVSVVQLAFATVLHQYFDLFEFTYTEGLPKDDDSKRYLVSKSQKVQYFPELASTISLRVAFGIVGSEQSTKDDLAPILVNNTENVTRKNELVANRLATSLLFARTTPESEETLISTVNGQKNEQDLLVYFSEATLSGSMLYNIDQVSEFVATGFADAVAAAIQAISSISLDTIVADLEICGRQSRARISQWNHFSTHTPDKLLHHMIGIGFLHKPDAIAILSWDGQMSYLELDRRSSALAAYLMDTYDLKPGRKVALCFEKCTWAIICMLAILKTGAAYCCLDPSHPRARHDSIIDKLVASVVLTSAQYKTRFDGHNILVPTLEIVQRQYDYRPTDVQPSDVCMVAFTSGSTGTPKGIVHTHNSLVTGILANASPQHLNQEGVATYQWSSYTFDVSTIEIYAPLIFGGRICIPSDEERINNVEESMNRMAVNWAYFTPSFARLFAQYEIPSLKILLMGGEVVTSDDINAWYDRVKVIHSYGPAESATFFLAEFDSPCSNIVPIGPAPNTHSWIVNPNNPDLLSPLGAIGEMLYEGPGLLKEYLGDPEKTNKVLIEPPSWRQNIDAPAPSSKLYRSGDLVRYLPDGKMMYIGRKDNMVKVRGQKLEVEEVESVIRKTLGESSQVAVDLVELNSSGARLVAFLQYSENRELNGHANGVHSEMLQLSSVSDEKMNKLITQISSRLIEMLPEFMIPRIYIPLAKLPTNSNGKLDRMKLKEHARNLSTSDLFKYTDSGSGNGVLTEIPEHDTVALEISDILVNILSSPESAGDHPLRGKNATLENLGLDSLRIVSFVRSINNSYGLQLPVKAFRKVDLKVRDIAEIVRSPGQVNRQSEQDTRTAEILQDIEKLIGELAQVQPRQQMVPKGASECKMVVFLTGATGFLGTHILRQLLALDSVTKVIVLVRADDISTGFKRIVTAAITAGWWSSLLKSRIEVWLGDLAQLRLGLSTEHWARLEGTCAQKSEAVTSIIHNGAVVNWSSSYERLRATNVLSTLQILKLALAAPGPLQHCTYVSGGDMHLSETEVARDASRLSSADGYSQSKFASDVLVDRCVDRVPSSRRINMVKPGIIIGTATEGISNTDDFIWRLTAGVCEAKAYVDDEQDAIVCLMGADQVAQRIIDACLISPSDGNSAPKALRMTQGIPVKEFWDVISDVTGLKLSATNFDDWLRVVNTNVSRQGPSHLLWPVMEWVEQRKGRIGDPRLENDESSDGGENRIKTLKALRKSVEYLSSLHFLQGETLLNGAKQNVFRRSGLQG